MDKEIKRLNKIVDMLEQRIAKLEKVLASHAKCIGELRGTELRIHDLSELTPEEFSKQVKFK